MKCPQRRSPLKLQSPLLLFPLLSLFPAHAPENYWKDPVLMLKISDFQRFSISRSNPVSSPIAPSFIGSSTHRRPRGTGSTHGLLRQPGRHDPAKRRLRLRRLRTPRIRRLVRSGGAIYAYNPGSSLIAGNQPCGHPAAGCLRLPSARRALTRRHIRTILRA